MPVAVCIAGENPGGLGREPPADCCRNPRHQTLSVAAEIGGIIGSATMHLMAARNHMPLSGRM
jgi:hypothetical protein